MVAPELSACSLLQSCISTRPLGPDSEVFSRVRSVNILLLFSGYVLATRQRLNTSYTIDEHFGSAAGHIRWRFASPVRSAPWIVLARRQYREMFTTSRRSLSRPVLLVVWWRHGVCSCLPSIKTMIRHLLQLSAVLDAVDSHRFCTPPPYVWNFTLWRPLLPYGYSYKASCARPG